MRQSASLFFEILLVISFTLNPWAAATAHALPLPPRSQTQPTDPVIPIFLPLVAVDRAESTQIISIGPDWQLPNAASSSPVVSADGRYVAFTSEASNLTPGDTNRQRDAFVVDRQQDVITRVSVASDGTQGSAGGSVALSADGRWAVFPSTASNLVSGDTNAKGDIFLHDLQTGQTTRVSVASSGAQADAASYNPDISGDGRWIVFESTATNLVAGSTPDRTKVYLYDREQAKTERISLATDGGEPNDDAFQPSISADGRYVVFQSWASNLVAGDNNHLVDVFLRDRQLGQTFLISQTGGGAAANGHSSYASVSADGRWVAFSSEASDLVSGDSNNLTDIFVRDRTTNTTSRVSVASSGAQAEAESGAAQISASGRFVVFGSGAANLVFGDANAQEDVFRHDLETHTTARVSSLPAGGEANGGSLIAAVSADGSFVAFQSAASNLAPDDGNAVEDIFGRDLAANQMLLISRAYLPLQSNATSLNPVVATDGRFVAFQSKSSALVPSGVSGSYVNIFVRDRQLERATLVSVSLAGEEGWGNSSDASISGSGEIVAFTSTASNLVAGDGNGAADIFVRDLAHAATARVSVGPGGVEANDASLGAEVAANGAVVCFASYASNLVAGDSNAQLDVFVRELASGVTERVSVASGGAQADQGSWGCSISADGRWVAFQSTAANLVAGDTNGEQDIFLRDRQTGATTRVSLGVGGVSPNGDSYTPSLAAEGRYVAFHSAASNLVANDLNGAQDVFVFDWVLNVTTRVSLASDGSEANGDSFQASLSADGTRVAFESIARNLIADDTNKNNDIYVYNLLTHTVSRVSIASDGGQGDSASGMPAISGSGRFVVFQSGASNLVPGDTNGLTDIFLRDRGVGS